MKTAYKQLLTAIIILGGFLAPLGLSVSGTENSMVPPKLVLTTQYAYADGDFGNTSLLPSCGITNVGCQFGRVLLFLFELLWYKLTTVLAFIAGFILDVFLFHSISSVSYRSGIIEAGWEILRNITNVVFIFSMMMIAFKMVFGDSSGGAKKTLLKTILIALVINFSLFITYVIIDSSNIVANIFYTRIETEDGADVNTEYANSGTSNQFLQSFFDGQSVKSPSSAIVNNFNPQRIVGSGVSLNFLESFLMIFSAGGLNVLMIWVFISICLLFLSRTVGLMLAAILSPIAFATLTIPTTGATNIKWIGFNKWLKQLLSFSFMAPVYMFFLYLIIVFSKDNALFNSINVGGNGVATGQNIINIILGVIIPFSIIAMLLYTTKRITESMAGELGAKLAGFVSKGLTGAAVLATGTAAAGLAATGGVSRGLGSLMGKTKAGKFFRESGKLAQTAKFDVSKIPGFKKTFTGRSAAIAKGIGGTSYADVDGSVRGGTNKLRERYSNFATGKTPESIKKWEDTVQEGRDDLTKTRIENRQRKEKNKAKDKVFTKINPDGSKIYDTVDPVNVQEALEKRKAALAKRTSTEAKTEKDDIRQQEEDLQLKIDKTQDKIKRLNKEKPKGYKGKVRSQREKINKLNKTKKDIEKTSLEGQIKQLEKSLERAETKGRSDLLKKDAKSRFTAQDSGLTLGGRRRRKRAQKQASRVGGGEIKTTPRVGGDADNA